jgi:ribosome-associated protein
MPSTSPSSSVATSSPAWRVPPPPRPKEPDLPTPETSIDLDIDSTTKATIAARAAGDKLGLDTVVLEVGGVLSIVDYFVITSGANGRQVRTIAEEVEDRVKAAGGGGPLRTEGMSAATWVLLDFGDVVVHVFLEETRAFYELERLWGDVPRLAWEADTAASAD